MQIIASIEGHRQVINVLDETKKAVVRELTGVLRDSGRRVQRMARADAPPPFTGTLRRRISLTVLVKQLMAIVRARAPHSWLVAHGRSPGKQPPIAELVPWIRRRGRNFGIRSYRQVGRRRTQGARIAAISAEARALAQAAFALAKSIAARGTRPHPFMDRAIATERPQFEAKVRAALERAVRPANGGTA